MAYVEGKDRNRFLLNSLDSMVSDKSIVRIIDAFVDNIDLKSLEFTKTENIKEGRPCYSPDSLLKLYIWGYKNGVHSSRKLAESCNINIEVMWLMEELKPDFRTISDFRKDNVESIAKVFYEFNKKIFDIVELGFQSIDGTKIQASNSKENNFTQNKLDDRIKWLEEHIKDYLKQMDKMDATESVLNGEFTKEELEIKLKETTERLERYNKYKEYMEENNLSQLSLTDKDSKLMKSKNSFIVGYNVQTAVDSNTHLITDFQTTTNPTDHGLLESTTSKLKENYFKDKTLDIVADKGYVNKQDIVNCLSKGIIPNVINIQEKNNYELELDYEENHCDKKSKKPEEIKKCLHSGIVPDIYKDIIKDCKVTTGITKVNDNKYEYDINFKGKDEMINKAKEGYFVRDVERNLVYCPSGESLRKCSIKSNGNIRYRNKFACKNCQYKNICFSNKSKWKDIDFSKDTIVKPAKWKQNNEYKIIYKLDKNASHKIETKKVKLIFYTDKKKMAERFSLSEHPFGTIKRTLNGYYFLLRNKTKVNAEFALLSLSYNIQRIINIIGYNKVLQAVRV